MKKFYLETLGCAKNRVDAEIAVAKLIESGLEFVNDPSEADFIILNSCGFIEPAREETIERFFELYSEKKEVAKMVLSGCLPRLFPEIADELKEADYILGIDELPEIAEILKNDKRTVKIEKNPKFIYSSDDSRVLSFSPYIAYLKIADGCDNCCTYCSIPKIRGHFRERALSDIIKEQKKLIELGIKEIVIIAQDPTRYGSTNGSSLAELIREMDKVEGDFRLRVMYLYPSRVSSEILAAIHDSDHFVPYFDIPVQHISSHVLKDMHRTYSKKDVYDLVERINRKFGDKAVLRTSIITGFPTENEDDLELLESFVKKDFFDYSGVFSYSKEESTPAGVMDGLNEDELAERYSAIQSEAFFSMERRLERFIGREATVLFEKIEEESLLCVGVADFQAPEVDGETYITNVIDEKPGDFVKVTIIARDGIDFTAEIIR